MLVVYCVLSVIVAQNCVAIPLYLEMHRTDPETGDVITTKIEIDDGIIDKRNLQYDEIDEPPIDPGYELNPAELGYYYDCSMPMPPIIERSINNYEVRQTPPSRASSVFDSTLAGFNSIGLNILSFGFSIYNVLVP